MRIVSLLPSATEIVYALGLEDQLVGVTFECNEPARARVDKRVVVGGTDTSTMTIAEIDVYVRARVAGRPRRRVAVVEWVDPLFAGRHWIPDQVEAAGGLPVGGHPGRASGATSWVVVRPGPRLVDGIETMAAVLHDGEAVGHTVRV